MIDFIQLYIGIVRTEKYIYRKKDYNTKSTKHMYNLRTLNIYIQKRNKVIKEIWGVNVVYQQQ